MKNRYKKRLSLFILFLLMPLIVLINGKPQGEDKIVYTIIEKGETAALESKDPEIAVFWEPDEFRAHYRAIHRNKVPQPQLPKVDFQQELVLSVSFGQQNTAGYSIELRNISTKRAKSSSPVLIVEAVLIKPPADALLAQMITHPYLLVSTPKSGYIRVELRNEKGETLSYETFGTNP